MPADELNELLDRDEVLAGLPAKRAHTLLFLIESRVAHLMAQSRQAMEHFLTEEAAQEREWAFLEAFALRREPPLRPQIQDLERFAPHWASLVPQNPRVQAAVAHRFAQKYDLSYVAVPGIRAALGLDGGAVQRAYQQLYHTPLDTIFAPSIALRDRMRWAWAALAQRIEHLPPFWTAFALTLTETAGATILALPIAVATIGPLPGVLILLVLGLVNVLTIACMAEAVTRSGTIRYGSAFIGQVVADYLGRAGAVVFKFALFALCFLILQVYYIGFASSLQDATRVPAPVWVALLFVVGLYFLHRKSLDATIASALVVSAINISLILILALLAFTHVRMANIAYVNVPFVNGQRFDPSILQLVFGTILSAYFGHVSVANCGQIVLRRDPGGRSLIWGTVAAMVTAIFLYCVFVVAANGAIAPEALVAEGSTVLAPLAATVGPIVYVLGALFVILGLGMGSIHLSLGLSNLAREWLPAPSQVVVLLPRRRGRLRFHVRGRNTGGLPNISLIYLGLDHNEPRFRLDCQHGDSLDRFEVIAGQQWEIIGPTGYAPLHDRFPALHQHGAHLTLHIMDADQAYVRVRINSSLRITYDGQWDDIGLSLADTVALPSADTELAGWMMRQKEMTPADVAAYTGQTEAEARATLDSLVEQGTVAAMTLEGASRFKVRLAVKPVRHLPQHIWRALDDERRSPAKASPARWLSSSAMTQRLHTLLVGEQGRFLLSVSPIVVAFLLSEWLVLTGSGSFAGLLNVVGVFVVSILSGIFPVLLLTASRRKGEYVPAVGYRLLDHPLPLLGIYLLSLGSILLHGLVIWDSLAQRSAAILVSIVIVFMTIVMLRRGAFARRLTVELREDQRADGQTTFAVTASGQPVETDVRFESLNGERRLHAAAGAVPSFAVLRCAQFRIPTTHAKLLKVWVHRITPGGNSERIPAVVNVQCGAETRRFDVASSGEPAPLPGSSAVCEVTVRLPA